MAIGGGVFTVENKVLPGAYINFISAERSLGTLGDRGVVAIPFISSWGAEKQVITVTGQDFQNNSLSIFGYPYTDIRLINIREIFKGANSIKLYRLGGGTKASVTVNNLIVTALYGGVRGNDLKVTISSDIDTNNYFVTTYLDNTKVDEQLVNKISSLSDNKFVKFSKSTSDTLTDTAGAKLTGGTDIAVTGNDYSMFFEAIEKQPFTTILYAGNDTSTKGLFTSFVKRLRDDEGYKITAVLYDYEKANHEGIISVKNNADLVYWVAGQNAGAKVNESLTNKIYDGEYNFSANYSNSQYKDLINSGSFVLYDDRGAIRVLKDINSFTEFTVDKNSDFSHNQVVRVIDAVANDTARIFNEYYLGKVQNDDIGRDCFKAELVNYHNTLQGIRAIANFDSTDIVIKKGTEKGDVVVNEYIEPVCAMDKLYMKCVIH